jgi:hypothetical protein
MSTVYTRIHTQYNANLQLNDLILCLLLSNGLDQTDRIHFPLFFVDQNQIHSSVNKVK